MKKKLIYLFTIFLTTVGLIGLNKSIVEAEDENNSNFTNKEEIIIGETTNESGQVISSVEEAIENAVADYETLTTIYLKKDEQLTKDVTLVSGQNIEIKSQEKDFQIGQTDLGYTLTISSDITLDRQAELTLSTNVNLEKEHEIKGVTENLSATDFYPILNIDDSLVLNGTIDVSYMQSLYINGSLNILNGTLSSTDSDNTTNKNIIVNKDAAIILDDGFISNVYLSGEGILVYDSNDTSNLTYTKDYNFKTQEATVIEALNGNLSNNSYILNPSATSITMSNRLNITNNVNIFPIKDVKVTATGDNHISVSKGANFGLGGLIDGGNYYSAGSNQLIFDGGANWSTSGSGNSVYFVNKLYSPDETNYSGSEGYGRQAYHYQSTSTTPLIGVEGSSTLNIFRGIVLQNNVNATAGNRNNPFGGGIGLGDNSSANNILNIYGAKILYNAVAQGNNDYGGAGIQALNNATINMYYGEINYNSIWSGGGRSDTANSADGAGVNLTDSCVLNMEGGTIGYNHGDSASNADGGGIIARVNSEINITNGNVIGNFVYGYGGGICLWLSDVTIAGGNISNNRATFGGGIATSANGGAGANVTLDDNAGTVTQISNNTAYVYSGAGGYGGGLCIGNNNGAAFRKSQSATIIDAIISNNTAQYGGGIANYSTVAANKNKLCLKGGTIINNRAYNYNNNELEPSYGYGIYSDAFNEWSVNSDPMIYLSGGIRVDSSNNIVINGADKANGNPQIQVSSTLTTDDGIVGLIRYQNENYTNGNSVVRFVDGATVDIDKFLLDSTSHELTVDGSDLVLSEKSEQNNAYFQVGSATYETLSEAINKNSGTYTITILKNKVFTTEDFITIPSGYNITIKGVDETIKTLTLASNIGESGTFFTIAADASLTLENVVIDGNSSQSVGHLMVQNNGTFTLASTAKLINNKGKDGFASVIEVGARTASETNIAGEISGNYGDATFGNIYLGFSGATLNILDGAIINNSSAADPITDIILEGGEIWLGEANKTSTIEIGTINKQGNGSINSYALANIFSPIGIIVNDNDYIRNRDIIKLANGVEGSDAYNSYFNLLEKHNSNDTLSYRSVDNALVMNNVLEIAVDFKNVWEVGSTPNTYNKGDYLENGVINEDQFDSLEELQAIKEKLNLQYSIEYQNGKLVFFINSQSSLDLASLTTLVSRVGYEVGGYVVVPSVGETSNNFYGISSSIDVSAFEAERIELGVYWRSLKYTFEFNNGGLSSAQGDMQSQVIDYENIGDNNTLNINNYYAVGFYFVGWKIRLSAGLYAQDADGNDLVWNNGIGLTSDAIIDLQTQASGATSFVLEAQWKSIFDYDGNDYLTHTGRSEDTAFIIADANALKVLAATVNGDELENIEYYNTISGDGLAYEANSYAGYYFELANSIEETITVEGDLVIGNIKDLASNYFSSPEAQNPIVSEEILQGSTPFSGTFNGNNKTININIDDTNNVDFVGLFGYVKDANISNLTVTGSVSGRISVGGIIGLAYGGNYYNLRNEANISFNGLNAGGVIGTYYIESEKYTSGSIRYVVNTGSVTYIPKGTDPEATEVQMSEDWAEDKILYAYQGSRAGGIIGQSWHVDLEEAYNSGNVTARFGVGGIIGTMLSTNDQTRDDSVVSTAFNSGDIKATAGLSINSTYGVNNSTETVTQFNAYVGGIVGRMYGASTLRTAMNIGSVTASWRGVKNGDTYEYNTNNPTYGARAAGGILGVTSIDTTSLVGGNKTVSNVINTGEVKAWTHIGGIAGILAYSELSYAINVGRLTADGKNSSGEFGGLTYNGNSYNFLGGLVGMGVSANIYSTAVFDGDITYTGSTDSIIQAIGDNKTNPQNGTESVLGYPLNKSNALKLATSNLYCQPNDEKPNGLDSTFFQSGWEWKSYTNDENGYYYYPQLASFTDNNTLATSIILEDKKSVAELSKDAVVVTYLSDEGDKPIESTYEVVITINLNGGIIEGTGSITIDGIEFEITNDGKELVSKPINYINKPNIDLSSLAAMISRENYVFAGWTRDRQGEESFDGIVSSTSETLYAQWEYRQYDIVLTGLQNYANGDIEINYGSNYQNYYTYEQVGGSPITLPTINGNNAYTFSHWEITLDNQTYKVTSFSISTNNAGGYIFTFTYDNSSEQVNLPNLVQLDFNLICTPINYQITYEFVAEGNGTLYNEDGSEYNAPTDLLSEYNINSPDSLKNPNIPGYAFSRWILKLANEEYELDDWTIANVVSHLISTYGVEGLQDITLIAEYKPESYYLTLYLNGGSFTDAVNGEVQIGDITYVRNNQGLWQTKEPIPYRESIEFVNNINENNITAPEGMTFYRFVYIVDSEEEQTIPTNMPVGGIQLYVEYQPRMYEITVDITNEDSMFTDINLAEIINNINEISHDSNITLEVSNNTIIMKAPYGSDATNILNNLVNALKESAGSYNFTGFSAVVDGKPFNYSNIRFEGKNATITLTWALNSYGIDIYDSLGNKIGNTIYTNDVDESITWLEDNSIIINSLKTYINDLNYSVSGYDNDNDIKIYINGTEIIINQEDKIEVNGYTRIEIQLTPKEYNIEFNLDEGQAEGSGYSLSYGQEVDYDSLPKPTKPGYDFSGWKYGDVELENGQIFIPNRNDIDGDSISLTATYTAATYEISFDINANKLWASSLNHDSITFTYGEEVIILDGTFFNFEGYNLNYIKDPIENSDVESLTINNDFVEKLGETREITLQVMMELKTIEITFDATEGGHFNFSEDDVNRANGAYYLENIGGTHITTASDASGKTLRYYVVSVDYNTRANTNLPTPPVKDGYQYISYSGQDNVLISDTLKENTIFEAIYSAETYNITLVNGNHTETIPNVPYGGSVTLPNPDPVTGYEFSGWQIVGSTDNKLYTNEYENVKGDMEFVAVFKAIEYNLTINVSGDSADDIKNQILEALKISEWPNDNIFTISYNTDLSDLNNLDVNGSLIVFNQNGKNYSFGTMPANDLEVTASIPTEEYIVITVQIKDSIDDKITVFENQYLAYGNSTSGYYVQGYQDITIKGYTFDNLWTYKDSNQQKIENIKFTEEVTLIASATPKEYTITYINQGTTAEITGYYGRINGCTIIAALQNVDTTAPGYSFNHWAYVNGTEVGEDTITHNVTVVAVYDQINYRVDFKYNEKTISSHSYAYNAVISYPGLTDLGLEHPEYYELDYSPNFDLFSNNNYRMPNLVEYYGDGSNYGISLTNDTYIITITLATTPKTFTLQITSNNLTSNVEFMYNNQDISIDLSQFAIDYYDIVDFGLANNKISIRDSYTFDQLIALFGDNLDNTTREVNVFYEAKKYYVGYNDKLSEAFTVEDTVVSLAKLAAEVIPNDGEVFVGFYLEGKETELYTNYIEVSNLKEYLLESESNGKTIKLNAKCDKIDLVVIFYDALNNTSKSVTVKYGTTYAEAIKNAQINDPSKQGYQFLSWYANNADDTPITESLILVAKWELIKYTINFGNDHGNITLTINDFIDGKYQLPTVTKLGYKFNGWEYQERTITEINFDDLAAATDHTLILEAKFEEIQYTLTINYDNGNAESTKDDVTVNSDYNQLLQEPNKDGYQFAYWMSDSGRINNINDLIAAADDDNKIVVYAVYTPNEYTVEFEVETSYGSAEIDDVTLAYNESYELPSLSANSPYKFLYWTDGKNNYYAGQTIIGLSIEETVTLTAVYSYVLSFDNNNNGTGTMDSIEDIISDGKISVQLPSCLFKREHYTFVGWSTNANTEPSMTDQIHQPGSIYTSIDSDTLYAIWKANTYTITYYEKIGETSSIIDQQTYIYGENPSLIAVPNKTGYDNSNNWMTEDGNLPTTYAGDLELYATYTPKDIVTTIIINNVPSEYINKFVENIKEVLGEGTSVEISQGNIVTIKYVSEYNSDRSILNKLFTEDIRYASNNVSYVLYSFQLQNTTTPAEEERWTLSFDTDNIVIKLKYVYGNITQEVTYDLKPDTGGKLILTEDSLEKRSFFGYEFEGWYSDEKFTTKYVFGNEITESVTLYAKYEAKTITVKYDDQEVFVTYDSGDTIEASSKEGSTFLGWAIDDTNIVSFREGQSVNELFRYAEDNNVTTINLTALYRSNHLTIEFASDEEVTGNMPSVIVTYDKIDSFKEPACGFALEGYSFSNWSYTYNGSNYNNLDDFKDHIRDLLKTGNNSITLKANFTPNTYQITYVGVEVNNIADFETYTYGVGKTLPVASDLELDPGYSFLGWSTTPNGIYYVTDVSTTDTGNKIYYAILKANNYTISFTDENGSAVVDASGNEIKPQEISYLGTISNLPIPAKDNYYFVGWYYNGQEVNNGNVYTYSSNINLVARFEEEPYSITINLDGGLINDSSDPITSIISYGSSIHNKLLELIGEQTPNKIGYTFLGWYYNGDKLTDAATASGDVTITAKWEANTYTINFDANDGTGYMASQTFTYDKEQALTSNTFTREGYTFLGWSTTYNGAVKYNDGQSVINLTSENNGSITLYAVWQVNTYTITFNTVGGSYIAPINLEYGKNISEHFTQSSQREGYTFVGWYTDSNYESKFDIDTTMPANNLVLYAKWEANTYTVTFDTNDGNSIEPLYYTVENRPNLPTPIKDGYRFIGWYLENGTTKVESLNGYHEDLDLVAHWELEKYNISYSLNGGTNNQSNPNTYSVKDVITFADPTREGYTFTGWYLKDDTKITSTEEYTGDLVLYARWEANTYTVTFDTNDGNSIEPLYYTVENRPNLPTPTKAGYRFIGWYLEKGTIKVESLNGHYEDLTLTAHWSEALEYNIIYNLNGGTNNSSNPNSYTVNDSITLGEPTRVGYKFLGWYKGNIKIETISNLTGDLVLEAKWEVMSYTISYDTTISDMVLEDKTIEYGASFGDLVNPLELEFGLKFVGWYYNDTLITKDMIFNYESDITLTAKVEDAIYNVVYDTNGGINSENNKTTISVKEDVPFILNPATKIGYKFIGWSLKDGTIVKEINKDVLTNATNYVIELKAEYEVNTFTVTYVDTDGNVLKTITNVPYGSMATTFIPTKDGYIFDAWYKDGSIYDFNTPITDNLTLVAMYKIREVSITVNINGEDIKVTVTSVDGTGLQADTNIIIKLVENETNLDIVSQLLNDFGVLSRLYEIKLVDSKGNEIVPTSEIRVSLSLPNETLASDKTYTIVNVADDFSGYEEFKADINGDNISFYTTHFSYYGIVITDKVLDLTWLWILLGVVGFLLIQVVIILVIKNRKYHIRFITKGDIKVKELKYKKNEYIALPKPKRLGYRFVGWYLDREFKYPANMKTMPNENLVLYARWVKDPINIGFVVKK